MAIAGKVAITPKGNWSASTAYTKLDLVFYDNASYVAIQPSTGVTPTNTAYWMLVVQSAGSADLEAIIDGTTQVGNALTLDGHSIDDIMFLETTKKYVSPSGSDETGDGTQGNPWKTIQKAVDECPPNSIKKFVWQIYLSNGVYEESVDIRRKVIRLYATDTENTDITLKGNIQVMHNAVLDFGLPIVVDVANATINGITISDSGNCYVGKPITIKNAGNSGLRVSGNASLYCSSTLTFESCKYGFSVYYNSSAYATTINLKDCSIGLEAISGGKISYSSVNFETVGTQRYTSSGGRIYTGEQNELTTANKPTGTYTGNGDATKREIVTGGIGNTLMIYHAGELHILTPSGVLKATSSGVSFGMFANFVGGILKISSANELNASGIEYKYQVL